MLYYEKEVIDGFPGFRLVSPTELADREAEAEGQMNPREVAGALATLITGVGGEGEPETDANAGDQTDTGPGSENSSDGQSNDGGLGSLLNQLAGDLEDVAESADVRESREDLVDRLFTDRFF